MAVFDSEQNKIIARIAYDGTVMAGKTTNLRQLCSFFTAMRRGDLFIPGEVNDRTLFFDWLQLEGGVVCGYALRCQLVTVPGQLVLARRRAHLISSADVIVFVCDSTPAGVREARHRFERLNKYLRLHAFSEVSLVVQANKQDLADALTTTELASELGIEASVPIIPARACDGLGVRETAVVAVRAAANTIQKTILERGIQSLYGRAESEHDLFDSLLALERSAPAWTIDSLLHQDLLNDGENEIIPLEEMAGDDASSPQEIVCVEQENSIDLMDEVTEIETHLHAPAQDEPSPVRGEPPFPRSDVMTGFIWPAASGRDIVRRLPVEEARLCEDLVAQIGALTGSGRSDAIIYRAGEWCLKTSLRRRFGDIEEGRGALLALARAKMMTGGFLLRNTVLVLQPDGEESCWLWTIAPWVKTLRSVMSETDSEDTQSALGAALTEFARAAVSAMRLAARGGLALDVHPSNFGATDGEVIYLDDDIGQGCRIPSIGHALLQRCDEYAHRRQALSAYLDALESEITSRLSRDDVVSLDLARIIDETPARSEEALSARRRLARAVARCAASGS